MNSFTFIYIIGVFIILNLFQGFTNISLENQLIYSSIFILLLGIPHGAIDHVLFFKKRKMSQTKFYSIYLGLSFLFVILWHILPVISLILFLLISAFHFGESQFADIFFNNCFKNGVLPIVLDEKYIDEIFKRAASPSPYDLTVNLQEQTVEDTDGLNLKFEIDPSRKHNLLHGLDDIAETLQLEEKISAYEEARTW